MLISPYSWLEEYTKKDSWVGGSAAGGGASEEVLLRYMAEQHGENTLKVVQRLDMPFLIREHERKFQYGVSSCIIWRKE